MTIRSSLSVTLPIVAAMLLPVTALGADLDADLRPTTVETGGIIIELGAGGRVAPAYEGSDEYEVSPFPIVSLDYLNIPGLFTLGSRDPQVGGFSIGPSFGYQSERSPGDYSDLFGTKLIDPTYEIGLHAGYEWTYAEIYGSARYAFGGADGLVGDAGINLIARPIETLELKAGPTISFASDDYMKTYFGVTEAESLAGGGRLRNYDPDGGFKSAGVAASARYEFQPSWFLNADASWQRLIGDAKDSPIVEAGSEDQFTFGLGLSKRFDIGF